MSGTPDTLALERRAHQGLSLLKDAIVDLVASSPDGLTNRDVAQALSLHSSYGKGAKDYLTWSILGELVKEGRVTRTGRRYLAR